MPTLADKAELFHALHAGPGILVLPNSWDPGSARLLASVGFPAAATSSAAVAWALGRPDGERLGREDMLAAVRAIAAAVDVPVTADMEAGYGDSPSGVADTIREVLRAGAVGVNLEDGRPDREHPLAPPAEQADRLRAARSAAGEVGVRLFINARTDVYLRQVGQPADRFGMAVERAHAYLAAGADGIFVPGAVDLDTIRRLVEAIPAPLNVILVDGIAPVAELERAGLRRLSTGGRLAQAAMGFLKTAATELRDEGTYGSILDNAMPFAELQRLFGPLAG